MVIRDLGKCRMTDNYLIQLRHSNKQSMLQLLLFTGTERTCVLACVFYKETVSTYYSLWLDSIEVLIKKVL